MDESIRYERGTFTPGQLLAELIDFSAAAKTDPSLEQQALAVGVPASDIDNEVQGISVETAEGFTGQEVQIIISGAQLAIRLWVEVIHPWLVRRRTPDVLGKKID